MVMQQFKHAVSWNNGYTKINIKTKTSQEALYFCSQNIEFEQVLAKLHPRISSVISGNLSSHTSRVDGQQDWDCGRKMFPAASKDQVLDPVREWVDLVANPLSMIFERSWQPSEVPGD